MNFALCNSTPEETSPRSMSIFELAPSDSDARQPAIELERFRAKGAKDAKFGKRNSTPIRVRLGDNPQSAIHNP